MAQKPKNPKRRKLTVKERNLLRHLPKSETVGEAAAKAGYSPKSPAQSGYQALKSIKEKAPDLFARHGLDDDSFIQNYLLPALNATETKCALYKGKYRYSEPMIAWGPRTATNRLMAELKGLIVKEKDTPNTSVKVIVVNASNRPAVRGTPVLEADTAS